MTQYVALFRGINVGGHNKLPMKDLRDVLAGLGCDNVQTYIQSGNAIFDSGEDAAALPGKISSGINDRFGFEPLVMLLDAPKFRGIAIENPFRDIVEDPKHLHIAFLAEPAKSPDLDVINDLKAESERYDLTKHAFYLLAPDGIARSKLAVSIDRALGVQVTSRNLNTVTKLLDMLDAAIS